MQNSKLLNFVDAMNLARLLKPHIPKELDMNIPYLELLKEILDSISPQDYYKCLGLLTVDRIETLTGEELLSLFADGLEKNRLIFLLSFFDSMFGAKNA